MQDAKPSSSSAKRKGRRRAPSQTPSDLPSSRESRPVELLPDGQSRNSLSETLDWRVSVSAAQNQLSRPSPTPDSTSYDVASPADTFTTSPTTEALGELDSQWLPVLYKEGFEAVFGSWMGRYSNPFGYAWHFRLIHSPN